MRTSFVWYAATPSRPPKAPEEVVQSRRSEAAARHGGWQVGDMVTEEALPTYMAMLNTLDGTRDETGASDTPWAHWTRKWIAEENRHGDVMNKRAFCGAAALE